MKNNNKRQITLKRRAGFTLVEIAVAMGLIIALASIGTIGASQMRKASRRSTCIGNQNSLWTAKRSAWGFHESIASGITMADGSTKAADDVIVSYLDQSSLPYCPSARSLTAPNVDPSVTKTDYAIAGATETTMPTCANTTGIADQHNNRK